MFITRRNCIRHFNKYRPQEKSMQLFATNTKTRTVKRSSTCVPVFDIKKETASFMQYIDYARIKNYDIFTLSVNNNVFFFLQKMVILETQENQTL